MVEVTKKILAYQQSPVVLTVQQSGMIPDDFLLSLTKDEQAYVETRTESPVEPVFFELLSRLGAAGVISTASHLLIDVHRSPPKTFEEVDGILFPLMTDSNTRISLSREFARPYIASVRRVLAKTEERFGTAHLVHLCLLPRFVDGVLVDEDIVSFGVEALPGSVHEDDRFRALYEDFSFIDVKHTWIALNQKLFSTHTLRQEVLERLSLLQTEMVIE